MAQHPRLRPHFAAMLQNRDPPSHHATQLHYMTALPGRPIGARGAREPAIGLPPTTGRRGIQILLHIVINLIASLAYLRANFVCTRQSFLQQITSTLDCLPAIYSYCLHKPFSDKQYKHMDYYKSTDRLIDFFKPSEEFFVLSIFRKPKRKIVLNKLN